MAKDICTVEECDRHRVYKLYCEPHYRRWKRYGDPAATGLRTVRQGPPDCSFEGCGRRTRTVGLCAAHYLQKFHGKELAPLRPYVNTTARDADGRKQCSTCFEWKPLDGFSPNARIKGGYHSFCKACAHGKRVKDAYGITRAEHDDLLAKQGGVCAICAGVNKDGRKLFVDHDHVTGAVRGLLCNLCNRGIGNMRDSIELLRAAVDYLAKGAMTREADSRPV